VPQEVAVVTGASSGIGAAIARALAGRGWHCVLLARNGERLRQVAAATGGEAELCDVGRRDEVGRVAAAVRERHPRIRLLVNNAGLAGRVGFLDATPEWIEELTRTNYLGGVWCLRAFLPALEAAAPSDLVNIVSIAGTIALDGGPYAASKHAQLAFSRGVAAELGRRGIRTHTVNPGLVETPGFPQWSTLPRWLRPVVIEPEAVAHRVVRAIDRDRREVFVPAWFRVPAVLQAVAPGLLGRLAGARGIPQRRG
jgi:NAD(P)-dependent dehydrogenase (short-subunit alcohol dehydrogenase family)